MGHRIFSSPADRCAIPLDEAWYCESCRAISNDSTCCCCASAEHSQRLALWLDRDREPLSLPATGVFLTVIPAAKKRPEEVKFAAPPEASRAA